MNSPNESHLKYLNSIWIGKQASNISPALQSTPVNFLNPTHFMSFRRCWTEHRFFVYSGSWLNFSSWNCRSCPENPGHELSTTFFIDYQGSLSMLLGHFPTKRRKYVDIKYHYLREVVAKSSTYLQRTCLSICSWIILYCKSFSKPVPV